MPRYPTVILGVTIAALLVACGGRADIDVTSVADIAGTPGASDFGARQTALAAEAATRAAVEPTRTATPAPSPTLTPLPSATPAPTSDQPAPTPAVTRESPVGPPNTPTPSPTGEELETATITGCGDVPLSIPLRDEATVVQVSEWQAMGEAATAIFAAWDDFFAIIEDMFLYNQVVNNTEVFAGADAFTLVAEEHLPALREISEESPFHELAQTIVAMTEDQVEMAQLLKRAGQEHEPLFWDQALAISATFDEQGDTFDELFTGACDYWVELSSE
jgi:hypothetical protein